MTVQAKTFLAEARHAYILTLDVDAGSSMVNISFSDDIPNQEPITIDVSDEALSAPAPYLKANGFGTEALSVVEGKSAESSQIYAYLNAAGGIAHCNLTTHSNTLIEQGWPESVDLANVPADILEDYLDTRKRNFEINGLYLDWLDEGVLDTLVYSKDDTGEYGLNVEEAQKLEAEAFSRKLNAIIKTGADEIPLTLLARAIAENENVKIKAPVSFSRFQKALFQSMKTFQQKIALNPSFPLQELKSTRHKTLKFPWLLTILPQNKVI